MKYGKLILENGQAKEVEVKMIDNSTLTSDCWLIQFNGLRACNDCDFKGKKGCGGGETLKKMRKTA